MAIIDGITVRVLVDGTDHKEYDDPHQQSTGKSTHKYVEAVSGKQFTISHSRGPDVTYLGDGLTCIITFNGGIVSQTTHDRPPSAGQTGRGSFDGIRDGRLANDWHFDFGTGPEICEIEVRWIHSTLRQPLVHGKQDLVPEDPETMGIAPGISAGPARLAPQARLARVQKVGTEDDEYVFRFRCCNMAKLQELGVVEKVRND